MIVMLLCLAFKRIIVARRGEIGLNSMMDFVWCWWTRNPTPLLAVSSGFTPLLKRRWLWMVFCVKVSLSFVSHRPMISHFMDLLFGSVGHSSSMKASSLLSFRDLVL